MMFCVRMTLVMSCGDDGGEREGKNTQKQCLLLMMIVPTT